MKATLHQPRNLSLAIKGLESFTPRILDAAARGLKDGLLHAAGVAQRNYLSGPRPTVLGVVSGRLRGSIDVAVENDGIQVRGRIGSNVPYAARHEFGFSGTEQVRAHTRVLSVKGDDGQLLKRRAIRERDTGRVVGFKESNKRLAGGAQAALASIVFVGAHSRQAATPRRAFIEPALLGSMPIILSRINRAIATVNPSGGRK